MTKRKIYKTIKELDASLTFRDESFKVAAILIKGLETQNVLKLTSFFGYPYSFIKSIADRLKTNKIWQHGKTLCDWDNEETGGIAFWVDVNVGLGYLSKV